MRYLILTQPLRGCLIFCCIVHSRFNVRHVPLLSSEVFIPSDWKSASDGSYQQFSSTVLFDGVTRDLRDLAVSARH